MKWKNATYELNFYKFKIFIDKDNLIAVIKAMNPQMVIMAVCYSQILDLKFLLEESGILSEIRLNRDLCIQSRGKILTMSKIQKEFL